MRKADTCLSAWTMVLEKKENWKIKDAIWEFVIYLHTVKKTSHNTEISYERDLRKMERYLAEHQVTDLNAVTETFLNSYMLYLERERLSPATVSRNVAAIRTFCQYVVRQHYIEEDPSENLRPPKVERKAPEILSVDEVDLLMRQPDCSTPKGIRDKAMLELLYATGIRVSELIQLKLEDLNLQMGYITCAGQEKGRVIPFGSAARNALKEYLEKKEIGTIIHYQIPPHLSEAYQYLGYREGAFPITERYAREVLSLPMYNGMTEEEQTYVIDALNAF